MSRDLTRRALKLMKAWSQRSSPHVTDLILKRLMTEVAAGNTNAQINTATYNTVRSTSAGIEGWAACTLDDVKPREEDPIDRAMQAALDSESEDEEDDAKTFLPVLALGASTATGIGGKEEPEMKRKPKKGGKSFWP